MLKRLLVSSLITSFAVAGLVAPADAATDPTSFVTISGNGGFVSQEQDWLYRTGDGDITMEGAVDSLVRVVVSGGSADAQFGLTFAAPPGETLVAGEYVGAQDPFSREAGEPGIDVGGDGRGCDTGSGRFTVREIAPDLSRFWVVYQVGCSLSGPVTFGEVRYNIPDADPEMVVAPGGIDWPVQGGRTTQSVPVTLVNTGSTPITVASAAITSGADSFTVGGSACAVIPVAGTCRIDVNFAPTAAGSFTGALTVTDSTTAGTHVVPLSGSAVAVPVVGEVAVNKTAYSYGEDAVVTAKLTGTYVDPIVWIYKKVGTAAEELVATEGVDANGEVEVTVPVKQQTTIRMAWLDGGQSGTDSTVANVIPIRIAVTTDRLKAKYAESVKVTVTLSGAYTSTTVKLYKKSNGVRKLVATKTVGPSGTVTVAVPVHSTSGFSAEWSDGVTSATSPGRTVKVVARTTASLNGYSRITSSGYAVYSPGRTIYTRAVVLAARSGRCVFFEAQVNYANSWRPLAYTNCVKTTSSGAVQVYLPYDKDLLGRPLRFRAAFRGDAYNLAATSTWKYAKYVR